jgi:hypothetical protein
MSAAATVRPTDAPTLPRVYLCGPIAAAGEAARGGYQACNRRSLEALRAAYCCSPAPAPRSETLSNPRSRASCTRSQSL